MPRRPRPRRPPAHHPPGRARLRASASPGSRLGRGRRRAPPVAGGATGRRRASAASSETRRRAARSLPRRAGRRGHLVWVEDPAEPLPARAARARPAARRARGARDQRRRRCGMLELSFGRAAPRDEQLLQLMVYLSPDRPVPGAQARRARGRPPQGRVLRPGLARAAHAADLDHRLPRARARGRRRASTDHAAASSASSTATRGACCGWSATCCSSPRSRRALSLEAATSTWSSPKRSRPPGRAPRPRARRSRLRARPSATARRPRPPRPGARQPRLQRDQVHARGRHRDVRLAGAATHALIEVRDTGVGIPADEQDRLFERFFRASTATERAIPGVGLGLTIARRSWRRTAARSTSTASRARDHVPRRLPLAPAESPRRPSRPRRCAVSVVAVSGQVVLVAEDDEDILDLVVLAPAAGRL